MPSQCITEKRKLSAPKYQSSSQQLVWLQLLPAKADPPSTMDLLSTSAAQRVQNVRMRNDKIEIPPVKRMHVPFWTCRQEVDPDKIGS